MWSSILIQKQGPVFALFLRYSVCKNEILLCQHMTTKILISVKIQNVDFTRTMDRKYVDFTWQIVKCWAYLLPEISINQHFADCQVKSTSLQSRILLKSTFWVFFRNVVTCWHEINILTVLTWHHCFWAYLLHEIDIILYIKWYQHLCGCMWTQHCKISETKQTSVKRKFRTTFYSYTDDCNQSQALS